MRTTNSTLLGLFLFLLATFSMTSTAPAQQSFTEDFTSATYKDLANTTADWNTAEGQLQLFPFVRSILGSFNTRGNSKDVVVSGDHAFVADDGGGLQILDISDPANPTLLGTYNTPSYASGIAVAGDCAFVADYSTGLLIIDISDPTNPTLLGNYNTAGNSLDVAVSGDCAYVADGSSGLVSIDISDPANPTLLGTYNTSGISYGVSIDGDTAYVADYASGLMILNITNPASILYLGRYNTPGLSYGVAVAGDRAYVADDDLGLQIIDISTPTTPTLLGTYDTPGRARGVTVEGNFAFVADDLSGILVIDISNPTRLALVETCDTPGNARNVTISGEHAFVADYGSGLQVVGISSAVNPSLQGTYDASAPSQEFTVSGNLGFVAVHNQGLRIIDISNPTNPTLLGTCDTPGYAQNIAIAGNYAYVADGSFGLQVINITDPTAPSLIGSCDTPGDARSIAVEGNIVFVADYDFGLQVIDVSKPNSPSAIGNYAAPSLVFDVQISGDYAFVAGYVSGLLVIDISDPANPLLHGFCNTPGYAYGVSVEGDCAFVADNSGLQVIDISDLANPVIIGSYPSLSDTKDIAVSGNYAFVTDYYFGIWAIDISDPANPSIRGACDTPSYALAVTVAGNYAYVPDYTTGVRVVQVFQNELDSNNNVGRSLVVDESSDTIPAVRLSTTQTESLAWELSTDYGANWQGVTPNGSWNRMDVPGADLMWRSTLDWATPGGIPAVSHLTLEWLNDFGAITSITDVPADQGGFVEVNFGRSAYDFSDETSLPVTGYNVYRRVDDDSLAKTGYEPSPIPVEQEMLTPSGARAWPLPGEKVVTSGNEFLVVGSSNASTAGSFPVGNWKLVASAFATQSDSYRIEATTVADSMNAQIDWSVYLVTTHTSTPLVWFTSRPDSGYSIDNIAPSMPAAVTVDYLADGATLDWNDAPESDVEFYRIYRDVNQEFVPTAENLLTETSASNWIDPTVDPWHYHYKITAMDFAGNESEAGSPESVSGMQEQILPARTALLGAVPNPFNPSTKLSFEMAKPGHVRLKVYDPAGHLVASLLDEHRDAGNHYVIWNGKDNEGRMSSAGLYLYRLQTNQYNKTMRMTLLK